MNTRKQVKLAALKKEEEHYCCNFIIDIQIKKQKNISFYRKKWRMARKKYKKTKRKEQLWIKSFSNNSSINSCTYHKILYIWGC